MRDNFTFTVFGTPKPQGSMRGFVRGGRAVLTSDNRALKPWRQEISLAAIATRPEIIDGPVALKLQFYFAKPKSRPKAWLEPACKPDLDKLCRAACDALTGICFNDDAQVIALAAEKAYGLPERVEITVGSI